MKLTHLYREIFLRHTHLPMMVNSSAAFPPMEVSISITHRCNLSCAFCLERELLNADDDELTTQEWHDFIGSTHPLSLCVFAGGEPFLRHDFMEILERAMRRRRCLVITNGTVIPDGFVKTAVDGRLFLVSFSIDGIGSVHDRLRNLEGAFQTAATNIEKLQSYKSARRARLPLVSLSTVILPGNIGQLAEIVKFAIAQKADFVTFSLHSPPVQSIGSLASEAILTPRTDLTRYDTQALREQFRMIDELRNKPDLRFLPVFKSAHSLLRYLESEGERPLTDIFHTCGAPYGAAFVTPGGDIFPCRIFYPAGNVRKRPFGELWNSKAMRQFRGKLRAAKIFPSCARCCRLIEK